jgi:hypothetical protein
MPGEQPAPAKPPWPSPSYTLEFLNLDFRVFAFRPLQLSSGDLCRPSHLSRSTLRVGVQCNPCRPRARRAALLCPGSGPGRPGAETGGGVASESLCITGCVHRAASASALCITACVHRAAVSGPSPFRDTARPRRICSPCIAGWAEFWDREMDMAFSTRPSLASALFWS